MARFVFFWRRKVIYEDCRQSNWSKNFPMFNYTPSNEVYRSGGVRSSPIPDLDTRWRWAALLPGKELPVHICVGMWVEHAAGTGPVGETVITAPTKKSNLNFLTSTSWSSLYT
jgi:hypothetical protein